MANNVVARVIARNAVFITLGGIALKAINFFYQVFVVRSLGDDRFGQYSTALAWVGLFSIVAELGVTQYAMREIARDESRVRALFWNVAALRGAIAIVGIAVISASATAVGYSPVIVQTTFVYACTFIIAALASPLEAVLTAHERLDQVSIVNVVAQLSSALLGTLVLLADLGIVIFVATGLLAMLPPLLLSLRYVRSNAIVLTPSDIRPRSWPALIRGGLPFGLITLTLTIAFSIDTVMLSWHVPDNEIGWYNVAYGFSGSLMFFFLGFSEAMVPSLTKFYAEDPGAVARWYHRTLRVIVAFGLPLALGATLLAEPLLRLLYGAEYAPAAQVLRIIAWDAPLLMFTSFCGNLTTVTGAERAAARIYGVNALANIALNAAAIPAFGIQGAAVVTVATDLIGVLQFHALFSRSFAPPRLLGLTARTVLALVAMSAAVLAALALNWHVLAAIAFGAAVYLPAALALGVLDATERALLLRALGRVRAIARPRSDGA